MPHIRSRKNSTIAPASLRGSLFVLTTLAASMAQAQQARPEQTMPQINVQSSADSYKTDKLANPKLTQPLVDTPQTISVIKKEIMQEQGATNIMEALRNTPGITMQLGENGNTSAGDTFQMRGFSSQSSIFVDGIRDLGPITRDTFNIEQLEIVKGPAGADIGRGASSGYLNLVTKVPTLDSFNNGTLSYNSASNKRVTADLNRKLGANSAFRVNVMGQNGGVIGRDTVESNAHGIAPSLAFGLGTGTRLFIYSQHVRQNNIPDGGVPTVGLPGFYNASATLVTAPRVDQQNYYGSVHDSEKMDADMATIRIEHEIAKDTTVRNVTRYGKSKIARTLTGVSTALSGVGAQSAWTTTRSRQGVKQENEIISNQTNITTEITTGSVVHSLSGGVEFMSEKQAAPSMAVATGAVTPPASLYSPDANVVLPPLFRTGAYTNGETTTAALYLSDSARVGKDWILSGGLRYEHYNTSTNSVSLSTAAANPTLPVGTLLPTNPSKSDSLTSWKVGAMYKPASNGSVYAAYSNSLTPPGSANFSLSATAGNANNPALDPQKATNLELGTKWDLLDKKLGFTAAAYRTEIINELVVLDAQTNSYAQTGKRRIEGVELGLVGQLTADLQISAGLATMKTKILQGTTGGNAAGAVTRWSPDLTGTAWATYKFTKAWTAGLGARYVSEQKRVIDQSVALATQNLPSIPSYSVADAMISYAATPNITVQLNVYNLTDKFYINTLNNGGARYQPGQPRSALLTANLAF